MPYQRGKGLPAERASKLGHLDVLNSELVNELASNFGSTVPKQTTIPSWEPIQSSGAPLRYVFGIDGSFQIIETNRRPKQEIGFVKTALLKLDQVALSKIDKKAPHPLALRDLLKDSAVYHATIFPLRNISWNNLNIYNGVRRTIFESVKDASLQGEPMETLKWIVYEKWGTSRNGLDLFRCPVCLEDEATLPYDAETGQCPGCGGDLYITDMLGFHQVMAQDSAPEEVPKDYMTIHETLLLFAGIKFFWEKRPQALSECLFVKDGPLSIRAQYSKLVNPIRRFLSFAHSKGIDIHIIGQEKSGYFFDHLDAINDSGAPNSLFIPNDRYVKEEIQHRPLTGAAYGADTNYGAKVFVKLTQYHSMVLNVPIAPFPPYNPSPKYSDLIGAGRIFATIPGILSQQYEGGLLPIQLANGIASLSTYPSAKILRLFAETISS